MSETKYETRDFEVKFKDLQKIVNKLKDKDDINLINLAIASSIILKGKGFQKDDLMKNTDTVSDNFLKELKKENEQKK